MELLDHLYTAVTKPAVFRHHRPLFLFGHMRANTSLCGHILGSHDEISGYYEMHNGYYSWKSFVRQKLLFYRHHPIKSDALYIFDKVLHDYYHVNMDLLNQRGAKIMFTVREPVQTIKSAVSQFRRERPGHEYCDVATVGEYYCTRLESLRAIAATANEYFYYNADQLRSDTDALLESMTRWLDLSSPLSSRFSNFHFSGKNDAGDLSGKLSLGKIETKKTDYTEIELTDDLIGRATEEYEKTIEFLSFHATHKVP
ncbi:sulfotransferase [Pseudomaricurvus alkylphenolicus]|uniref:sulfotransferase n=1 Tax=Pseudomaricurvus alkylphenolicus TaxID=1306991 RepID=UPI00141D83B2|nr:sulfotransferase [Pseudomaricurvus alkylphenolicus]NIB43118.1 sulfotransferase [Pseudomaricurvus alkylphenolicus]